MSSVLDLLSGSFDERALGRLGAQIGATPQQAGTAVEAALPMLLGALQRNAASPQGASALGGALDRDHDGSVLDDVAGFFGQDATPSDLRSLGHIFGDRKGAVEGALSRASGLNGSQITQLLAQLAPLVLGALARARRSGPATPRASAPSASGGGGLGDLLGAAMGQLHNSNSGLGGLLGGLLDADGDGSVVDDILGKAFGGGGGGGTGTSAGSGGGGLGSLLGGLLGGGRRG